MFPITINMFHSHKSAFYYDGYSIKVFCDNSRVLLSYNIAVGNLVEYPHPHQKTSGMQISYITRNGNIIAVQKKESCHLMVLFFVGYRIKEVCTRLIRHQCVESNILLPCKRKRTSNDFDKIVERLAEVQTSARGNSKRCSNPRADLCLEKCVNTFVRRTNRSNFSIVKKRISV